MMLYLDIMKIQIDPHTLERAEERGTNENEIKKVLDDGEKIEAKRGRMGKSKVFDFGEKRNGKFYPQKKVEVYYTVHQEVLITVTAYVFYGKWEK